jgi:hypothetical protein
VDRCVLPDSNTRCGFRTRRLATSYDGERVQAPWPRPIPRARQLHKILLKQLPRQIFVPDSDQMVLKMPRVGWHTFR